MKNIPTDLLRTFVTVIDNGGFTAAGLILGRTQPAISLQIKRLEDMLDTNLLQRDNNMLVTEQGAILLSYARQMLAMNDAAITRLQSQQVSGKVRLGIPADFEISYLPRLLSQFSASYPDVALEINCDISDKLQHDFQQGHYDLALATYTESDSHKHSTSFSEAIAWVSNGYDIPEAGSVVNLVTYPHGCRYRQRMTTLLNEAGITWRIAYSSSSLLGITAAIQAGLGVSAMAASTVPDQLVKHLHLDNCPDLGNIDAVFLLDPHTASPACLRLQEHLQQHLLQNSQQ